MTESTSPSCNASPTDDMTGPAVEARAGGLPRRAFLAWTSAAGVGGTLFPGVLWGMAQDAPEITKEMIASAERVAGLDFTEEQRDMMVRGVRRNAESFRALRAVPLSNAVPPAVHFDPLPTGASRPPAGPRRAIRKSLPDGPVEAPDDLEDVAFWPVTKLSELIRTQQVTSVELTEMYLSRLKWFDSQLHCVVTLTEELAMEQAERADEEIARGHYRGPLHGIPWGAKDLLNTKGIPTTYGAKPFENQVFDDDATVVERLREAGAVLVAKLSLGALAMGDVWFREKTRNPWNTEAGSSGSSAGPGSATAAGLVGFSIGTETLGSIVSPSTRCGVTGLRPTYGRVSRAGAMALSWTMDKLGPMCRSVEDCALVFDAIHGADPRDRTAVEVDFAWNPAKPLKELTIGYLDGGFRSEQEKASLEALRGLGVDLVPVTLPDLPVGAMVTILNAEAACAFDDITRDGRVDQLVAQGAGAWPNSFRTARSIPAVEYLRANRVRTLLLDAMAETMEHVDVFMTPPFAGGVLTLTNLSGHPCLCMPNGFRRGSPTSITFIGKLYGESDLLRVAMEVQNATGFHLQHPELS